MLKIFYTTYDLLQGSGELHRKYGIRKTRISITICSVLRTVSMDHLKKNHYLYSCSNKARVKLCQERIIIYPVFKYLLKSLLKTTKMQILILQNQYTWVSKCIFLSLPMEVNQVDQSTKGKINQRGYWRKFFICRSA